MSEKDQLKVPGLAKKDRGSIELLRVWIAESGQHISLRTGILEDPAAWGMVLADIAQHVANAYTQEAGFDRQKTLDRIKAGLDAEWSSPTDEPSGKIES